MHTHIYTHAHTCTHTGEGRGRERTLDVSQGPLFLFLGSRRVPSFHLSQVGGPLDKQLTPYKLALPRGLKGRVMGHAESVFASCFNPTLSSAKEDLLAYIFCNRSNAWHIADISSLL